LNVDEAQREVRQTFRGGLAGQLVSGVLWLISAGFGTWGNARDAIVILVIGGFFIFPLTQAVLRILGGPSSLSRGNPLNALGMQVAFVLPLSLPLVGAAALYRETWFYPAFMIALGAHYLPFVFLYGMRLFAVLSAVLVTGGILLGMYAQEWFTAGAWLAAAVLLAFAVVGGTLVRRERIGGQGAGAF